MTRLISKLGRYNYKRAKAALWLLAITFFLFVWPLNADVLLLRKGGKIEGNLLNPNEVPKEPYLINALPGLEIEIETKYIDRLRKGERETLATYDSFAPLIEDTLENHLEIARWCRENKLSELNRRHLNQVLVHDPNHAESRQLLGHIKAPNGTWTTRQELLAKTGIERQNGRWRTQQQVDVEQILEQRKQAEADWEKEITRVRTILPGNERARDWLLSITDPVAARSIRQALDVEKNADTRILLISALANIGTLSTIYEIARWAVNPAETVPEVRYHCFDAIKKRPEALPPIIGFYTAQLDPANNTDSINAVADALGRLNGTTAIPQLINVLTVARQQERTIKSSGASFDNSGSSGLGWGESKVKDRWIDQNPRVLDALIRLTGYNFQYNKDAWKNWLIESRRTPTFNARRG